MRDTPYKPSHSAKATLKRLELFDDSDELAAVLRAKGGELSASRDFNGYEEYESADHINYLWLLAKDLAWHLKAHLEQKQP